MKKRKKKHDPTKERWLMKQDRDGDLFVIRDNEHNEWPSMYSPVAERFSTREDAQLAATAPELYAVVKLFDDLWNPNAKKRPSLHDVRGAAKAVLAKAKP
jgi:hypothetical protein